MSKLDLEAIRKRCEAALADAPGFYPARNAKHLVNMVHQCQDLLKEVDRLTQELSEVEAERDKAKVFADGFEKESVRNLGVANYYREEYLEMCKEVTRLAEKLQQAERERDEAQKNYQFMVFRAADNKLDGYRELGAAAAKAENERDTLKARLSEVEKERDESLERERGTSDLLQNHDEEFEKVMDERDAATQLADTYRKALEEIDNRRKLSTVDSADMPEQQITDLWASVKMCWDIARQALKGEG